MFIVKFIRVDKNDESRRFEEIFSEKLGRIILPWPLESMAVLSIEVIISKDEFETVYTFSPTVRVSVILFNN